jgi:hypothetical protein
LRAFDINWRINAHSAMSVYRRENGRARAKVIQRAMAIRRRALRQLDAHWQIQPQRQRLGNSTRIANATAGRNCCGETLLRKFNAPWHFNTRPA